MSEQDFPSYSFTLGNNMQSYFSEALSTIILLFSARKLGTKPRQRALGFIMLWISFASVVTGVEGASSWYDAATNNRKKTRNKINTSKTEPWRASSRISREQIEIMLILCASLLFGYFLLKIRDVVFGETEIHHLEDQAGEYVHVHRPALTGEEVVDDDYRERSRSAPAVYHFSLSNHVREEEEENLEAIISTSSKVGMASSSLSTTADDGSFGLRKRNLESTNRDIHVVEGEEGYLMVSKN